MKRKKAPNNVYAPAFVALHAGAYTKRYAEFFMRFRPDRAAGADKFRVTTL